jgi:hypothetical protein
MEENAKLGGLCGDGIILLKYELKKSVVRM